MIGQAGGTLVRAALAGAALYCLVEGSIAQENEGQVEFNNNCRTCHTMEEGDNRLGPHLHGIVGRKAGSLPDYTYSSSMQASPVVWDEDSLDRFIENPEAVVSGNSMKPFAGIADPQIRAAIIDYLAQPQ